MTSKLSGKIALVTGGSAGIGLGIAKRFAEEGARVFVIGRRRSELDKAVTAIGGGATAVQGDISNLDDLDRIYAAIKDKAGRIDVLAVNAGYYEFGSFGRHHQGAFRQDFQHQCARPAVHGPEGAAAVNREGVGDPHRVDCLDKRLPVLSVYNASKAAVRSFARS